MRKALNSFFYVIMLFSIFFASVSFIMSSKQKQNTALQDNYLVSLDSNWFYFDADGKCITIETLPATINNTGSSTLTIYHNYNSNLYSLPYGSVLAFLSNHQSVNIYSDNTLLYSSKDIAIPFGKSTGAYWNISKVPPKSAKSYIKAEITNVYGNDYFRINPLYMGNINDIRFRAVSNNMTDLIIDLFLLIMGICFIILKVLYGTQSVRFQSLYYLGLFAILLSVWEIIQTRTPQLIFVNNQLPIFYFGYIITMLISVPLVIFAKTCYDLTKSRFLDSFCVISLINCSLQIILQAFNLLDFYYMALFSYILYFVALISLLVQCIKAFMSTVMEKSVTTLVYAGSIPLLIIFGLIDILRYVFSLGNTRLLFLQWSLALYILALGYVSIYDSIKLINKGIKAEKFEMLAYKDVLTGIKNRAAFREYIDQIQVANYDRYTVAMFDLNNLKYINDTFGHTIGDDYIINSAHLISKVFSSYGVVFRLGGDEFCAILENISDAEYYQCTEMLDSMCEKVDVEIDDFPLTIACGYAAFDSAHDSDLIDTFNRADINMYKNKQFKKSKMAVCTQ